MTFSVQEKLLDGDVEISYAVVVKLEFRKRLQFVTTSREKVFPKPTANHLDFASFLRWDMKLQPARSGDLAWLKAGM